MKEPKQCRSKDRMKDLQCQGIPGHTGPHWGYDEGGQLIRWVNKREKDPKWKHIACSWTPPGHKTYITPEKMHKHHYMTIWAREVRRARQSNPSD